MNGRKLLLVAASLGIVSWAGFRSWHATKWTHLTGETMGTNYQIHFQHSWFISLSAIQHDIDSLLLAVTQELSTWDETSWISEFNRAPAKVPVSVPPHAWDVLKGSLEIAEASGGAFDPASFPIIQLWGFGPKRINLTESPKVDTIQKLLPLCNHQNLILNEERRSLTKALDGMRIDCSALAKGYTIDQIAALLEDRHLSDFSIEIGGEVRASGSDPKGKPWTVRLQVPYDFTEPIPTITLRNQSIATSGGSQVFKTIGDVVYTHIVDPRTGYPIIKNQPYFSASVVAPNCMVADALATACFVLGPEKSSPLVEAFPGCSVRFIPQ